MITDDDSKKLLADFGKVFATKDDLKQYATKNDVQNIVDQATALQDEKIHQQLTQFRSDIFDKLDLVIGELKTNREEREIIAHQVTDHEDRLETIETQLQITP